MLILNHFRTLRIKILINEKSNLTPLFFNICKFASKVAAPAKAVPGSGFTGKRRFRLPVESDIHKIVNNCCGANYGSDYSENAVKLKDDNEYPEWLWSLRLEAPPSLDQIDPNTKEYWERLAMESEKRQRRHLKAWPGRRMYVGPNTRHRMELTRRRQIRAVAAQDYDAGYEIVKHSEREDYAQLSVKERLRLPESDNEFIPGKDKVEGLDMNMEKRFKWAPTIGRLGQ